MFISKQRVDVVHNSVWHVIIKIKYFAGKNCCKSDLRPRL